MMVNDIHGIPKRTPSLILRHWVLEAINLLFNHGRVFTILGWINRRVCFIESIFLVYPASVKYGHAYARERRLRQNKWMPWLTGVLVQNKKVTLMLAISATTDDFLDSQHHDNLQALLTQMENMRSRLHVTRKTFAGILPGVMYARRLLRETPEADLTATIVAQGVAEVIVRENLQRDVPLVVLGGRGFIGRRVVRLLAGHPGGCQSVDLPDSGNAEWPVSVKGKPVLLVNITTRYVLDGYLDHLAPGTVVLNEVYPEPDRESLGRLAGCGCHCYHIAGVKGLAIPSFPSAYRDAVPCCGAWPSPEARVVVVKLT